MYHYANAALSGDRLINQYSKILDTAELADVKNSNILWKALAKVGPEEVVHRQNSSVLWKRDTVGLMNIPVRIENVVNDFVFDTGANLSMISTSYAKLLHLQLIETAFDLGSSTSITNKATLAIAPSLFIGNIELKNVVFMVLPDDKLAFPQIHYKINAIIGYPVISELGEVTIKQSGTLLIPANTEKSLLHNLAMDGLLPVLAVKTGNDTLSYSFDTGAKQSMLYKPYFDKYKNQVIQNGKPDSVNMGGAGGVVKYKSYRLPTVDFRPADKFVQLTNIDVLTSTVSDNGGNYDGTIGQDLIAKFREMVINFKDMYIDFN
jgi:predicted aspartyl protease